MILYLILLTVCNLNSEPKQQLNCKDFRTGTYSYQSASTGEIDTRIIRTEEYQIEEYFPMDLYGRFKIEWVNDCTYTLAVDSLNEAGSKMEGMDQLTYVQIVETTENSYKTIGWEENTPDIKVEGEVFRLNE